MNRSEYKFAGKLIWAVSLIACAIFSVPRARAGLTYDEYVEALKIVDQEIARKQSSPMLRETATRPYLTGDHWTVALIRSDVSAMRMTDDPAELRPRSSLPLLFRYEVTQIRAGASPSIVLRVTQVGKSLLDPQVEWLELRVSPEGKRLEKRYKLKGRRSPVKVSPDSARSTLTALEALPLDFPDLRLAKSSAPHRLPPIPKSLSQLVSDLELPEVAAGPTEENPTLDSASAAWFEHEDFYGRPIQALWKRGELWPAYLKTPQGISVLVRKGAAHE